MADSPMQAFLEAYRAKKLALESGNKKKTSAKKRASPAKRATNVKNTKKAAAVSPRKQSASPALAAPKFAGTGCTRLRKADCANKNGCDWIVRQGCRNSATVGLIGGSIPRQSEFVESKEDAEARARVDAENARIRSDLTRFVEQSQRLSADQKEMLMRKIESLVFVAPEILPERAAQVATIIESTMAETARQSLFGASSLKNPVESCSATEQSFRNYQEDRHDTYATKTPYSVAPTVHGWAVYDGHGGDAVSEDLVQNRFLKQLVDSLFTGRANPSTEQIQRFVANWDRNHYRSENDAGSTMTAAVLRGDTLFFINLGDSRAALFAAPDGRVLVETIDNDPSSEAEIARIKRIGLPEHEVFIVKREWQGKPMTTGRVGGELAVSRAFGDAKFKRRLDTGRDRYHPDGAVSAVPDVFQYDMRNLARKENLEAAYLVLATDGVWDCCMADPNSNNAPSEQATKLFADLLARQQTKVADVCRAAIGAIEPATGDNKTIIMVRLEAPAK